MAENNTLLTNKHIKSILLRSNLFHDMEEDLLDKLISHAYTLELNPGECLITENHFCDELYIILSGRFVVSQRNGCKENFISEFGMGEILGTRSLLGNLRCLRTVKAIRKSLVLTITKKVFEQYILTTPAAIADVTRASILQTYDKPKHATKSASITFIPAGSFMNLQNFINQLVPAIQQYGSCKVMNADYVKDALSLTQGFKNYDIDNDQLTCFLLNEELKYDYVIYIANPELDQWTNICIQHADRIITVGDNQATQNLNHTEAAIFSEWSNIIALKELVIIHASHTQFAEGCKSWLKHRVIDNYYHIKEKHVPDFQHLARCITGNALAVVMSGGGARGLSFVGALKAFEEFGLAVDYWGGTSAGGIIALIAAMGVTYETAYEYCALIATKKNYLLDFTIPTMALTKGKKIEKFYKHVFTPHRTIEELWRRAFLVATNISTEQAEVLSSGPLWEAVRKSTSLPGIFPPVIDDKGHIFMDGVLKNNLPVDLMSQFMHGNGRIIAMTIKPQKITDKYTSTYGSQSGHSLLLDYFNPLRGKEHSLPNIFELLSRSINLSSQDHQALMKQEADHVIEINTGNVGILEFEKFDAIIKTGYLETKRALNKFEYASFNYKSCD